MCWILIKLIRFYQLFLSPVLPKSCRYLPTCSDYMIEAVQLYGLVGVWLGLKRLFRCHPWHDGGYDPVQLPEDKKKSALRKLP